MKPRGLITALLLCASVAAGQEAYSAQKSDFAIEKNGGLALPSGYLTIKEEAGALTQRDILSFVGTSVTCADTAGETVCTFSSSGAPTDATYIMQTANASTSAEQALSSLSTGIMRVATTTGVITSLTDSAGISANLSDETGSGALVFATSPTLVTPALGTPSALVLTNATGLPVAGGGTGAATFTIHGVLLGQTTAAIAATSAGSAGQVLTSNGASSDPTFQAAAGALPNIATTVTIRDDFGGFRSSATSAMSDWSGWLVGNTAGTNPGNGDNGVNAQDTNHWGVLGLDTGTGSGTGSTALYRSLTNMAFFGTEDITWLVRFEDLSTATDQYTVRAGFCDSLTASCTDGAWFGYTDASTGAVFTINTNNNAGPTTANTATTVAADTWYTLRIMYESGVGMHYYVNGVETANSPINTTIPTTQARATGPMVQLTHQAGTTNRTIYVDYVTFTKTVSR